MSDLIFYELVWVAQISLVYNKSTLEMKVHQILYLLDVFPLSLWSHVLSHFYHFVFVKVVLTSLGVEL